MILDVKTICKEYACGKRIFSAVDSVSLTMKRGDCLILNGRSGSGKTTLLNIMAGLLTPDSGQVFIDKTDIYALSDAERSALRNRVIGYIPQGQSLLANLTVLDNVRLPFFLQKKNGSSVDKALSLLEKMQIADLRENYPAHLSGGEMRRVAIARALINDPEFIIADEPTSDLDLDLAREIASVFADLNGSGMTLLIATHDPELSQLGTYAMVMRSGRLEAASAKQEDFRE